MAALVRADAAETSGAFQIVDVLLNRASGNAERGDKTSLREIRIILQQLPEAFNGFLTAFSDRFFLTAFFYLWGDVYI